MDSCSTRVRRFRNEVLRCAFLAGWIVVPALWVSVEACSAPVAEHADTSCLLPLRNGDFTEFRRVGNTRAVRWSRLAHWTVSHPQHNLGEQYDGLWGAELLGSDHYIWQRVPTMASLGGSRFDLSFATGAFGDAEGQLIVGMVLTDASGRVVKSHGLNVRPPASGWRRHRMSMSVGEVTEGAQLKIVFKRQGQAGGRQLVVADVRAHQSGE